MPDTSCLYTGEVMHHRLYPLHHRFIYRVFACCLNLGDIAQATKPLKLFSLNRFNLFSFHEKDHAFGSGNLYRELSDLLHRCGYSHAIGNIQVLCYPRILGYQFNPLTVYFCYDPSGQLQVIIHEVHNTFGQRHLYLLPADSHQGDAIRQETRKKMYVSPFTPMQSDYRFRVIPPRDSVRVCIRQRESDSGRPLLDAVFRGDKQTLSDRNLIRNFFSYPLLTLKVITAIHWEALRLWRRKLKVQPRDATQPLCSYSWQSPSGETRDGTI